MNLLDAQTQGLEMNIKWHNVHITDSTGKVFFNTTVEPLGLMSEIKNLQRHVDQAKANQVHYSFLDANTVVLVVDGVVYNDNVDISDDDLLAELGL